MKKNVQQRKPNANTMETGRNWEKKREEKTG